MITFPDLTFACSGSGDCCSSYTVKKQLGEHWAEALPLGDELPRLTNNACWYLRGKTCNVYEIRPSQCRQFPFEAIAAPNGTRVTLSPECECVLEQGGGPLFADPSAITAATAPPAFHFGSSIEVDEGLPPISFQQYELLEAKMIELGAEGALVLLQQVLTELPVLAYASEPIKLALQRARKIAPTEVSYPFKLWVFQGYPARSGSLRRGFIELRKRWEKLNDGVSPITITREARLLR